MKKQFAAGLAVSGILGIAAPATAQQQDPILTMFTVSTYGLAVDERCQVFDHIQYETAKHLQLVMRTALKDRAGEAAVSAEEERLSELAAENWTGCLARESNASEWQNIDSARFYVDALIAAPGAMDASVESCALTRDGKPIQRSTMSEAKAIADARYAGKPTETDYTNTVTAFASQMTKQCIGQVFSSDLIGPKTLQDRQALKMEDGPNSVQIYGDWTAYKFFSFESLSEFGVSAYRTPDRTSGPLVGISLKETGSYDTVGVLYVMADGSLEAVMQHEPTGLQIRDEAGNGYTLQPVGQVSEGPHAGRFKFVLDAATAEMLMANANETTISIHATTPDGEPAHQYPSYNGFPGKLPLSRLKDAIAWASVPIAPDL
ncbi:hypothetical protein WNY37_10270 [Henriciella sp. AS95]|uniref:hypothetical protein n=1 Tax=Henriciella sp. AS95 TaxID=3135782 RepID=UPI0031761CD5